VDGRTDGCAGVGWIDRSVDRSSLWLGVRQDGLAGAWINGGMGWFVERRIWV